MKAAPTLHPGDQFARYSIVGPLGAGGMGEVYLAQDRALERNVALKVLPPALVRSEERVRRFMLEAKSASSLNHPNIVTIYEIGQERLGSDDGSPATDSPLIHFISMELVTGKTLSRLIHEDKTDLRTLLGILAQVAEGVAKAHAAGIVHRDLKPGNIMVTGDGFAKVLDFGLAKLTERREAEPDATSAGTLPVDQTDEGAVVGTAGYMSPEQVQGKPADHRSDVFSFGCVLYEAVTGRRPFSAESSIETMHRILNDKPAPIEEVNPQAPAEVRRLIRRCLAKNPEQRYQSMKDLAIELREIVDEFDSLSPSGSSGSTTTATTAPVQKRSMSPVMIGAALAAVAIAATIGALIARRGGSQGPPAIRMTTVTDRGDVGSTTISRDGRYLAYQSGPPGRVAIWVRQIATGSDVQVLPAVADLGDGLTFSPDGNYLYYLRLDPEHRGYRALYQVPSLGGRAVKKTYDVDTEVSFAPDGKQVCFFRGVPTRAAYDVVIVNLDTGIERVVASVPDTRRVGSPPCWSPRGDRIAMTEEISQPTYHTEIALYRVKDGRRETVATPRWPKIDYLAWMPDGRAILVDALDLGSAPVTQLRSLSIPGGRTREITHDQTDYSRVSVSGDGKTLATQRTQLTSNLWMAPVDGTGEPHPITTTSGSENAVQGVSPTASGAILFTASSDRYLQLWTVDPDGSNKRALTNLRGYVVGSQEAGGGAVIAHYDEDSKEHLSRLDADGGLHTLVPENGAQLLQVTLDGTLVAYTFRARPHELWIIPVAGGIARKIADDYESSFQFCPDGRRLIYLTARTIEGRPGFVWKAMQVSGEPDSVAPLPPRTENLRWMVDNASLSYIDRADSCWNVYRRPLAGGVATPVTHVHEGHVISHVWSPDGTRLALLRQLGSRRNLWIAPANGGEPRPVTNFQTGTIFGFNWARDGKSIVFTYGDISTDAVLIRDFQ